MKDERKPTTKLLSAIFATIFQDEGILEEVDGQKLDKVIEEVIESLNSPRARQVIDLRFGFIDYPHTQKEVGIVLGITKARIWQIEEKLLRRMRHPTRLRKLKPFIKEELNYGS